MGVSRRGNKKGGVKGKKKEMVRPTETIIC